MTFQEHVEVYALDVTAKMLIYGRMANVWNFLDVLKLWQLFEKSVVDEEPDYIFTV